MINIPIPVLNIHIPTSFKLTIQNSTSTPKTGASVDCIYLYTDFSMCKKL